MALPEGWLERPTLAVSISKLVEEATLAPILGVIGGIYLFVRGLDNMEKGRPASIRQRWDDIFPPHKPGG